jgi:hypothetical protein
MALLRVGGKTSWMRSASDERPRLVADDGHTIHRFSPLPAPPDGRGVLRAAYSVPADLLSPDTAFSLELTDGVPMRLPAPTPASGVWDAEPEASQSFDDTEGAAMARAIELATAYSVPDPWEDRTDEEDAQTDEDDAQTDEDDARIDDDARTDDDTRTDGDASAPAPAEPAPVEPAALTSPAPPAPTSTVTATPDSAPTPAASAPSGRPPAPGADETLEERIASLEAAIQEARDGRNAAEARALEAERQVRTAAADAEQQARVKIAQAQELADARLLEVRTELQDRISQTRGQVDQATAAATAAMARIESLQTVNAELEQSIELQRDRLKALEDQLAAAAQERADLKGEIEGFIAARDSREQQLQQMRETVSRMTAERDEMSRQAAAFDQVAVKARERAAQAESSSAGASATISELETWRAELERRLADATNELESARSAQVDGNQEVRRLRGALAESEAKVELAQVEIDALKARAQAHERDTAESVSSIQRMQAELEALRATRTQVAQAVEVDAQRLHELAAERDENARRADAAAAERDWLASQMREAAADHDQLAAQIEEAASERDRLAAQIEEAAAERDRLAAQLSRALASGEHQPAGDGDGESDETDGWTDEIATLLAPAKRIAELSQEFVAALADAERRFASLNPPQPADENAMDGYDDDAPLDPDAGMQLETGVEAEDGSNADGELFAIADLSPDDDERIEQLSREAEAEAREQAIMELLQASGGKPRAAR